MEIQPKNKTIKYIVIAITVIVVCIGIGIGVALAMRNNNSGDDESITEGNTGTVIEPNDEETKRITEETVNKYTEIKVEGYREVEDNSINGKAVVINVKNISEETVSLAIVMGAYDSNGNLLDTSSLYAEGIQPGQTHIFNTFVYSELTPEQLESATYKVYKANTYTVDGVETSSEGTEEAPIEEAPTEESADSTGE